MKKLTTVMPVYGTGTRPSALAPATSSTRPAFVEMRRERAIAGIAVRGTGELRPQNGAAAVVLDQFPTPFPGTTVCRGAPA